MERKIIRQLNVYYYGMMVLALVALTAMYLLLTKGMFTPLDTMSGVGRTIQYVVILDALLTIPLGLYGFKRMCMKLSCMEDKTKQLRLYGRYAAWRIVIVSNAMLFGIVAFYLFGGYRSMLWVAAIAAIAWYFTKPTVAKMQIELQPQDQNQETY